MKYFVQLKLLIWKNWILRKRNKLRTAIEFLWPIVIFFFLILLHNLGVRRNVPNCYFKPKAMPSAGELLFIQTLICSFNNTCDKVENSTIEEYDKSLLSNLGLTLREEFEENINRSRNRRSPQLLKSIQRNWLSRVQNFPDFHYLGRGKLPQDTEDRESLRDMFVLGCLADVLHRPTKSNSTSRMINPFFSWLQDGGKELRREERNVKGKEVVELMAKGKQALIARTMLHTLLQYSRDESNTNGSLSFFKFVDSVFCGPQVPPLLDQINSVLAGSSFSKKYSLKESIQENKFMETSWENDTTDFCNNLIRNFSSEESYKLIFGLMKPFFRGKILYSPDAPVINRIMNRINETFSKLEYVKDLIADLAQFNRTEDLSLYEILIKYRNDKKFLKRVAEMEAGKEFLKYYGKKTIGKENDPRVVDEDAAAFGEIIEESAEHLRLSMNDSTRVFGFRQLKSYLECIDYNRIIPMEKEEDAVKESLNWLKNDRFAALIVFVNVSREAETLPPSLTYKIRTGIERTPKTTQIRERVYVTGVRRNVFQDLKHITGGFSYLQNLIESELIREYTGREKVPGIYLQQMPFPCHIHDTFLHIITRTLPVFMVISWCYTFGMIVKKIVAEKENHLKGTLRIYGIYSSQHWIAWFVDAFVPVLIISLILSAMLVFGEVIPNSDYFLIWVFMVTFGLPTISFAFLVSVCFSKSSFALNVSMVIFFLLYLIYPPIQNFGEEIDPNLKSIACIISNVAFGLGCTWIANMEEIGVGARFSHINYSPIPGNPISMGFILQMLLLDSAVYLLIALYLENVHRAEESVRLPWNYVFTRTYWRNTPKLKKIPTPQRQLFGVDDKRFEAEPDLPVGIETINLTKEYGYGKKKRKIVNNLSMKFYENQITSFLGHNGAGKTTSISMMSGLGQITSGAVLIYGVNLAKDPEIAGKDIGICRQENVLIDELTVEEHLWLFSRLKNRSVEETKKDAEKMIHDLQLEHRAKTPVRNLSGGMKRKVCLATAFIGGPRTIFLDEPTAGVDPFSRRSIWNLLIKYKQGRTLILTTHFLDEADLLGDRIAIIANGKLQCCGSSIFLKNNFGRGYYLTVERRITNEMTGREIYDRDNEARLPLSPQAGELNTLITEIIPEAKFLEEIGSEITFILPLNTKPNGYQQLFNALNNSKASLNLLSYGISNTSLVEVFFTILKEVENTEGNVNYVTDAFHEKNDGSDAMSGGEKATSGKGMDSGITERALDTKIGKIITQQFFALLIKRIHHHRRNYKLLVIEILLPAIFIAIALTLVLTLPAIKVMPPLTVDISAYSPSLIFYRKNTPNEPAIDSYEKSLLGPYGLGTKCVLSPEKCTLRTITEKDFPSVDKMRIVKNCSCDKGNYNCEPDEDYQEPPKAQMSSGDFLYNMTSLDLVSWLLTTELNLSSTRYGGMELGYHNVWTGITVDEFFNLFMIKKFISLMMQVPKERDSAPFEIDVLSNFLISFSYNKTYGDELFKSRNPWDNILIWYNNRGWIAGMAFMNSISNLVLRSLLPEDQDPSKYSIKLVNHPLPITERQLEEDIDMQINTSLLTAIAIIWALSFIPAMFAIYIVEERMSGLKHLQIVSGISKSVYWMVALIWDMTLYSVNVLTIVILFFAFDIQAFINEDGITAFILLLYAYGFANISFVYAVSYMFITPSIAFVFVACYNIFVGMITLWMTFFLDLVSCKDDPIYLKKIFLVFPPFCFGRGLVKMALVYNSGQIMKTFGLKGHVDYMSWSITLKYLVVMIFLGMIFFATTILIQFRFFPERWFNRGKVCRREREEGMEEEEDVKAERLRVELGKAEKAGDMLVVSNLTKCYLNSESPAVDRICFGVKKGECFGLLGLNGAGKTTAFKMLTGCLSITDGDASIRGFSLRKNLRKARLLTGYCPQGNALDPYLTCEEHLSLFSRIRGITGEKKEQMIDLNIKRLGLTPHRHKIVRVLSGGNKRKLNTAIALMGDPQVVLLDEPTSGMDYHSRRLVWKCIQRIVNEGRCVVLTSHNMEECQALCTKLSIMVRGKLKCFGSCQHLKSKFDDGYNITVRMTNLSATERVKQYMEEKLPQCTLVYVNYLEIRYRLLDQTHLGLVFDILNEAKNQNLIYDYSLSQTTLENVFLKLANDVESTTPCSRFRYLESFCSSLCK